MSLEVYKDLYSTANLQAALEVKFPVGDFIQKTFFRTRNKNPTDYILIDKKKDSRLLATYCSAVEQGVPVNDKRHVTDALKPAYIKETMHSTAYLILQRGMGKNPFEKPMSPRSLAISKIGEDTAILKDRVLRRIEKSCIDIIFNGIFEATGKGVDISYNFRPPTAEYNWLSNNLWTNGNGKIPSVWSNASANIIEDIYLATDVVRKTTGRPATDVVMGKGLLKYFRSNEEIQALLDNRRIQSGDLFLNVQSQGVEFVGNIGNIDFWVYSEYYEDYDGSGNIVVSEMFPENKAIVTNRNLRSSIEFGQIYDFDNASTVPQEMFIKSDFKFNPSVVELVLQSSFIPTHHQLEGVVVLDPLTT